MKFDTTLFVFVCTTFMGIFAYIIKQYFDRPKLSIMFNGVLLQSSPGPIVIPVAHENEPNAFDARLSIREFNCQWRGNLVICNFGAKTATGVKLFFHNDSPQFIINNFIKDIDMISPNERIKFETIYRLRHQNAPANRPEFERINNFNIVFSECKFLIEYKIWWFIKAYTIYEFKDKNHFKLIKPYRFNSLGNYKPKNGFIKLI